MSKITTILSGNQYPTGICKFHYTFDNFSNGKLYSELGGKYFADIIATGSKAVSQTGNAISLSENGYVFCGGAIDGGVKNENYLKIDSADEIDGEKFTILLVGGLRYGNFLDTNAGFLSGDWTQENGPAYDFNPLLSNRETGNFCSDGWTIGLNSINRLTVEANDFQTKRSFSFSHNSNGPRDNIWAVKYINDTISVGRYDIIENEFDYQSARCSALLPGADWFIGSGIDRKNLLLTGFSGNTTHASLRSLIYFDEFLDENTLKEIVLSEYGEVSTTSGYTGISGLPSFITGTGLTYVSGITGIVFTAQNYSTYGTGYFQYKVPMQGAVTSGNSYYSPLTGISGLSFDFNTGEQLIYETLINTGATITGITGFSDVTGSGVVYSGTPSGYVEQNLSGAVLTGYSFLFSTTGGSFYENNLAHAVTGEFPEYLYPYSLTYIGERYSTRDFVEHLSNIEQVKTISINKNSDVGLSTYFPGVTPYFEDSYQQSGCNLFINGVCRFSSGLILGDTETINIEYVSGDSYIVRTCTGEQTVTEDEITTIIRQNSELTYNILGDWFLTGNQVLDSLPFNQNDFTLQSSYDYDQFGSRAYAIVSSTNGHTGLRNSNIPHFINDNVFYNGQKLTSGLNYTGHYNGSYTEFRPIGWITGTTGMYFSTPAYTGQTVTTGTANYDIYGSIFYPKSKISFINGVRLIREDFVEHDNRADMITGGRFVSEALENIYE